MVTVHSLTGTVAVVLVRVAVTVCSRVFRNVRCIVSLSRAYSHVDRAEAVAVVTVRSHDAVRLHFRESLTVFVCSIVAVVPVLHVLPSL